MSQCPIAGDANPIVACSATTRVALHPSAERPILRQISSLMYPKIQRRQVTMNMFFVDEEHSVRGHPGGRLQFSGGGSGRWFVYSTCVLIHSCKMPQESETTGLNDTDEMKLLHVAICARRLRRTDADFRSQSRDLLAPVRHACAQGRI